MLIGVTSTGDIVVVKQSDGIVVSWYRECLVRSLKLLNTPINYNSPLTIDSENVYMVDIYNNIHQVSVHNDNRQLFLHKYNMEVFPVVGFHVSDNFLIILGFIEGNYCLRKCL